MAYFNEDGVLYFNNNQHLVDLIKQDASNKDVSVEDNVRNLASRKMITRGHLTSNPEDFITCLIKEIVDDIKENSLGHFNLYSITTEQIVVPQNMIDINTVSRRDFIFRFSNF